MNLHEYQGKQLFKEYGLPVSDGIAASSPEEAVAAADKIGGSEWVVKCQVHAGGRGKAGGVKLVKTKDEIKAFAEKWLGKNLVTFQTDEHGQPVTKIAHSPQGGALSQLVWANGDRIQKLFDLDVSVIAYVHPHTSLGGVMCAIRHHLRLVSPPLVSVDDHV